jgi:lipoprotein-anchoring transpeptidase ErfK/SrfK
MSELLPRTRGFCIVLALAAFLGGGTTVSAADLRIEVDLSTRLLSAWTGSEIVRTYKVSVGMPDEPTPTGTFQIRKLVWNPAWHPPNETWAQGKEPKAPGDPENPMQRVKIFFKEPDYYIHGTPAVDSMGHAKSHGCVRMTPADVTDLAKLVMSHGGQPKPEPWYRRLFRRRTPDVVVLSKPIPIRVTS